MARTSHKRKSYSPERRKQILDTAAREGLTATDVKKKFGVTPVTYYSWRKKTGATVRRGRGGLRAGSAPRGRRRPCARRIGRARGGAHD